MIQFDEYFSKGLVQPPTSCAWGSIAKLREIPTGFLRVKSRCHLQELRRQMNLWQLHDRVRSWKSFAKAGDGYIIPRSQYDLIYTRIIAYTYIYDRYIDIHDILYIHDIYIYRYIHISI